jgi:DNA repair photolyase
MNFQEILQAKKFALFEVNDTNRIALNLVNGCRYNCKYCQARVDALVAGTKTAATWADEEIDPTIAKRQIQKESRVYVFPAAHDLHRDNLEAALSLLIKILAAGNRVVITTKPYFEAVRKICEELAHYKTWILFQFSIGSINSQVLKYWEPGAPDFNERFEALKWAFYSGFYTSVICEPILDNHVENLIEEALPYVNGAVWLGGSPALPEIIKQDPDFNEELAFRTRQLLEWQSRENLWNVYQKYLKNPQIKWNKNSFDFGAVTQTECLL